jgi:DNA modification methylase
MFSTRLEAEAWSKDFARESQAKYGARNCFYISSGTREVLKSELQPNPNQAQLFEVDSSNKVLGYNGLVRALCVWGGDSDCDHTWDKEIKIEIEANRYEGWETGGEKRFQDGEFSQGQFCSKCQAWLGAYGLEPSPQLYLDHTAEVLKALWRVLKPDGVMFWNLGDCMKDKQLIMMPFRVALMAQEMGWYIRSDIIWSKPNPMPETVHDRPAKSHEYIFLMTKEPRYFWDADAVKEPQGTNTHPRGKKDGGTKVRSANAGEVRSNLSFQDAVRDVEVPGGRNLRTIWTICTQSYEGSHFATFPEEIPKRAILAGTSQKGNCPSCGKPWVKDMDYKSNYGKRSPAHVPHGDKTKVSSTDWKPPTIVYKGWKSQCSCGTEPVPAIVLDPFCGSGTTIQVARALGRHAIGLDISPLYRELADKRADLKTTDIMRFI